MRVSNLKILLILILSITSSCRDEVMEEPYTESDTVDAIGNVVRHDNESDYIWSESDFTSILLNDNSITIDGEGAVANGTTITISSSGNYKLSGTLTNGQIIVNTADDSIVRLILNGAAINCSYGSAIYVKSAKKTMIVVADETTNSITDGTNYTSGDDGPNAAIYSADDLTIYGNGSLTVTGNYADGITSKDGLIIASAKISVKAVDDGIRGKDYLIIKNGDITIDSKGDGIKSDNDDNSAKGYISLMGGNLNVLSGGDAISAETDVFIAGGVQNLTTGNGVSSSSTSQKGIKAGIMINISGGDLIIYGSEDAIHSDQDIEITGGTMKLSSGDDGIHAEYNLLITDGSINIAKSYEGLESALGSITISGGNINITASDDGINVSAGGASTGGGPGRVSAISNSVTSSTSTTCALNISGGHVVINNEGDGIDSNDALNISGGTIIVNSAEYNENSSIDCDGICKVSGGTLICIGVSQMAQAPGTSSTQYAIMLNFKTRIATNNIIHIEDSNGNEIMTCKSIKSFSSFIISTSSLKNGTTYKVYIGGSSTGTLVDGVYTNGTYSGGTLYSSFTLSSIITTKTI